MKKVISILLLLSTMLSFSNNYVFALTEDFKDKDNIIKNYQEKIIEYNMQTNSGNILNKISEEDLSLATIQTETVIALNNLGYTAYDVNPDSFSNIENVLQTDLAEAGLNPNCSYIILIEGDEENNNSRASTSSSFVHTFNGTNYNLRWMTTYASDDPLMGKSSHIDILSSSSSTVIQNCLDATISAYISSIYKPLGTIASICGLSISNFSLAKTTTMTLNAGTNWTRRYTQVWCSYDNSWKNGCCVEEVSASSYIGGFCYNEKTNQYEPINENMVQEISYSSKYFDTQWRKDYAVRGYLTSMTQWDIIGDVVYKYNDITKITHRHNF